MNGKQLLIWTGRIASLLILFYVFFIIGTMPISGMLPDAESEPGLVDKNIGFLFFGIINMLLIIGLIRSSHWNGWKLALLLGAAYYGAVTFVIQIEAWYFMSSITFDQKLLPYLFIMGLPVAFIYIPLAVLILGKGKKGGDKAYVIAKSSYQAMDMEINRHSNNIYITILERWIFHCMAKC